jgi:hypothetical protein
VVDEQGRIPSERREQFLVEFAVKFNAEVSGLHQRLPVLPAELKVTEGVPASILARMLGIHIGVAVQWQRATSGDWGSYAADISRRDPQQP